MNHSFAQHNSQHNRQQNSQWRIEVAAEDAFILYYIQSHNEPKGLGKTAVNTTLDDTHFQQVQALTNKLLTHKGREFVDVIPSYTSILVTYKVSASLLFAQAEKPDEFAADYYQIKQLLISLVNELCFELQVKESQIAATENSDFADTVSEPDLIVLPVYYHPQVAPDLNRVAERAGLSIEDVIALHSHRDYRVFSIGFAPGFGYLGQVDEKIATPRLATPRAHVAKGSVAIADQQTAIYPADSPGGWNIIGRCPLALFDINQQPNMLFNVGDKVSFRPIGIDEFISLGGQLS